MPNTKPVPPAGSNADAVGVDQQRDAPGGIERGLVDTERRGTPNDVPAPERRVRKQRGRT